MKKLFLKLALLLTVSALMLSCSSKKGVKGVTIASKQFTENILLSEMYAQLIEYHTDIEVVRRQRMGSAACFPAMESGAVDIYVDYTGTIYKEILRHDDAPALDSQEFFSLIKEELNDKKGITVYPTIGMNNTFTLAMKEDYAASLGVETMSDLSPIAHRLVFAANENFYTRTNDGYRVMQEKYGVSFESAVEMDTASMYEAITQSRIDVMVAYATDSQLKEHKLTILKDDKEMFPEYCAVPIIRNERLKEYPELDGVINMLSGRISDERMQELNYLIDFEGKGASEVARDFLTEEGLLN